MYLLPLFDFRSLDFSHFHMCFWRTRYTVLVGEILSRRSRVMWCFSSLPEVSQHLSLQFRCWPAAKSLDCLVYSHKLHTQWYESHVSCLLISGVESTHQYSMFPSPKFYLDTCRSLFYPLCYDTGLEMVMIFMALKTAIYSKTLRGCFCC